MTTDNRAHRPSYQQRYNELLETIDVFENTLFQLPGLAGATERSVLVNQLIDSERRNTYFGHLLNREIAPDAVDPHKMQFDPLKAAIFHWRAGRTDEAYWLVFQYVHFGKHPISGWRYVREVYGRLGAHPIWSWDEISSNTPEFRLWLGENQTRLRRTDQPRGFGNHRKYSSLSHESERGTASVFESYVSWVLRYEDHVSLFKDHTAEATPQAAFEAIYNDMDMVIDFGRIAKFDYLMTISRLKFLDIRPGHTYLENATGPLRGARLLLEGPNSNARARELRVPLEKFAEIVGVTPDVVEDAICNWQKSPGRFKKFVL